MFTPMQYTVTKVWPSPDKGVSCCFRQWRAKSHCKFIHGYDLVFSVTFMTAAKHLTNEGWVIDFGGLDYVKKRIEECFDHKFIVADDDPGLEYFKELERQGIAQLQIFDHVGCEAFACWLAVEAQEAVFQMGRANEVWIYEASVYEHGSNKATYRPEYGV